MSDTHPPGGWPWGKGKPGSQNPASEVQGSQAQLQQQQPGTEAGQQTPIRTKDEGQSQAQSNKPSSAFRSPESVTNKSVKYEDEQPVSVEAPGSNKSFSRTGKEAPSGAGDEEESEFVDNATETGRSKKNDALPEDEGKDLSEPAGDEQTEKAASQNGSGFTSILSGAKHMFSSSKGESQAPDSIRQLQDQTQSQGGETLTVPESEQDSDVKTSSQENTPADSDEAATTQAATTTQGGATNTALQTDDDDESEGLTNISGEELRPEDSITHAADNSRLPTEGQTGTEFQTEAQTQAPTEGQTEGQTEYPQTEGQTEYPQTEGQTGFQTAPQTEYQTEGQTQGQTQAPTEAQTQAQTEGRSQAPQSQFQGQFPQDRQTNVGTETTGYETATTEQAEIDYSILKGCKVNKLGNVVNDKGQAIGRITQGIMSHLIGRKVDENGIIWNDSGKEMGRAEPIPDGELQDLLDSKPFESFEGNVIDGKGWVKWQDQTVGKVIEGDLKVVQGKSVDADGEILDKSGNVIGKAERWEEEEPEPEVEPEAIDMSILAGKRVNKSGNLVDSSGVIYGRVIDGDLKHMVGRMCNKNGEIVSESGDVLGHAELVSEGEREGAKEGSFAELNGLVVAKDGTVVTSSGDIVGRLVSGDPKVLAGRAVDQDGDILDSNGNVLGHAERWEPEPEEVIEKEKGALAGLIVNNDGNVVDKNGNIVAKLTSGDPYICAGKEIDDDGDVVNAKGMTVGHVTLLSEIKEEEVEEVGETDEEKQLREQRDLDKKLATQMAMCLEHCLDKIKPICKMITTKIEAMERKPEDERDEEALVKEVRPLIEEGGNILREAHGIIRGLDPDGHIQANAKHKSGTREASSEEFHLAEVIKEVRIFPLPPRNMNDYTQQAMTSC